MKKSSLKELSCLKAFLGMVSTTMERKAQSHATNGGSVAGKSRKRKGQWPGPAFSQTRSIPSSLLSEFTAISFQDNLRVDGTA